MTANRNCGHTQLLHQAQPAENPLTEQIERDIKRGKPLTEQIERDDVAEAASADLLYWLLTGLESRAYRLGKDTVSADLTQSQSSWRIRSLSQ